MTCQWRHTQALVSGTLLALRWGLPLIFLFLGQSHSLEWRPLEEQFSSTTRQMDELMTRSEKLSKLAGRSGRSDDGAGKQKEPTTRSVRSVEAVGAGLICR